MNASNQDTHKPGQGLEAVILTVTKQAASIIRALIRKADLPPGAGLRIAQREDHTCLAMTLAREPRPEDLIVAEHDAAVFLAPVAAGRVSSQVLDGSTSATRAAFFLRD